MSSRRTPLAAHELAFLVDLYLDGDISVSQRQLLNNELLAHSVSRELFVELVRQAGAMKETLGTLTLELTEAVTKPKVIGRRRRQIQAVRQPRQKMIPWLVSAAAVVVFVGLMVWQASKRDATAPATSQPGLVETPVAQTPAKPASPAAPAAIAHSAAKKPTMGVLVEQVAAKWAAGSAVKTGGKLDGRVLQLESGLAKIRMNEGAELIVEGPAQFTLETESDIHLAYGKAVATCRKGAEGFTIRSAKAKVTDLGTEFGVQTWGVNGLQTVVFDGSILVEPETKTKQSFKPQLLEKGKAVTITADDEMQRIDDEERFYASQFVRGEEFAAQAKAAKSNRPFDRWQAYSYKLRRDPSVLAYYDFQAGKGQMLHDRSCGFERVNGRIYRAKWDKGRFPGKKSLRFDGKRTQTRVLLDESYEELFNFENQSFTIAIWLRPDSVMVPYQRILGKGNNSWRLHFDENPCKLSFETNRADKPEYLKGKTSLNRDQWYFVVITCRQAKGHVKQAMYIDNRWESTKEFKGRVNSTTDPVMIGWISKPHKDLIDTELDGLIDELIIFRRILERKEITALYEAGKPK